VADWDVAHVPRVLFRIGRAPDPLAWPLWERIGADRFDAPHQQFRVLYAAEERFACFLETLASLRPSLEVLARLRALPDDDSGSGIPDFGRIPGDWNLKRMIGSLALSPGQRWLELRRVEAVQALRRELAETFAALGREDFDMSDALSRDRPLTQAVAQWAYDQGYNGIAYRSRFDVTQSCWAIFDGAHFAPLNVSTIAMDDPDFLKAAANFGLRLHD
jgi:hypothetical protein